MLQYFLAVLHRGHGLLQDLFPALLELVLEMDVGGGDEGVDAGLAGLLHRLPGRVDIRRLGPGQGGDLRPPDLPGHGFHRFEVPPGGEGKPGLDDVHVQELQLPGNLQLFVHIEAGPGGLLAVPERGVEDIYFFGHDKVLLKNRSNISGP